MMLWCYCSHYTYGTASAVLHPLSEYGFALVEMTTQQGISALLQTQQSILVGFKKHQCWLHIVAQPKEI
jgi:hypothetical protein